MVESGVDDEEVSLKRMGSKRGKQWNRNQAFPSRIKQDSRIFLSSFFSQGQPRFWLVKEEEMDEF